MDVKLTMENSAKYLFSALGTAICVWSF